MARSTRIARNVVGLVAVALTIFLFRSTLSGAQVPAAPGDRAVVFGVGSGGLSVREGPGYRFPVLAVIHLNSQVDVVDGPTWYGSVPWVQVTGYDSSGGHGWAAGTYLQPLDEEPAAGGEGEEADRSGSGRGGSRDGKSFIAVVTGYAIQGRTATGAITRWGLVAVDPTVIPLGSKLLIDGFEETFVAADTGGGVKGAFVDIWFPSYSEAMRFGAQARRVTIVDSVD